MNISRRKHEGQTVVRLTCLVATMLTCFACNRDSRSLTLEAFPECLQCYEQQIRISGASESTVMSFNIAPGKPIPKKLVGERLLGGFPECPSGAQYETPVVAGEGPIKAPCAIHGCLLDRNIERGKLDDLDNYVENILSRKEQDVALLMITPFKRKGFSLVKLKGGVYLYVICEEDDPRSFSRRIRMTLDKKTHVIHQVLTNPIADNKYDFYSLGVDPTQLLQTIRELLISIYDQQDLKSIAYESSSVLLREK